MPAPSNSTPPPVPPTPPRRGLVARVLTLTPPWWGRAAVLFIAGVVLAAAGAAVMLPGASGVASVEVWAEYTPAGAWVRGPARTSFWPDVGPPYIRLRIETEWTRGWGWTRAWNHRRQEGGGGFGGALAALPTPGEWAAIIRDDPDEAASVPRRVREAVAAAFAAPRTATVGPGWAVARMLMGAGAALCLAGVGLRVGRESRRAALRDSVRAIARGRCPRCTYELGGRAPAPERLVCPECGTDLTALRAEAEAALGTTPPKAPAP